MLKKVSSLTISRLCCLAKKEIHFIPDREEIHLVYEGEDYSDSYRCRMDADVLQCLTKKSKEISVYNDETEDDDTEEVDYYNIPFMYLVSLMHNNKVILGRWEHRQVSSWLSVEVIERKNNVE